MKKEYPPQLISNVPGTWAHSTVRTRLPEIAGRVIEENHFPEEINHNLSRLQVEIKQHVIRPLIDQGAPDQEAWSNYIEPYLGQSWLDIPWFFAEHYFYRRIVEAVDYFRLGKDPFGYQKEQGLGKSREATYHLSSFLQERITEQVDVIETFKEGMYFSLWGNQADLSLWPAGSEDNPTHASMQSLQDHLLANDLERIINLVVGRNQSLPRVDLLLDNAGFELISDLALVDILLSYNLAKQVILHAKAHPTFVSDVIPPDVLEAIRFLIDQPEPAIRSFGKRLWENARSNRLLTTSHLFWNSPLPMWELPADIADGWRRTSLVISKGDANYRRLLGDRQWDFTLPFQRVVDYLQPPLAALRTLKAELALGMSTDQINQVSDRDPNWLVDGRWGVIHFAGGKGQGTVRSVE